MDVQLFISAKIQAEGLFKIFTPSWLSFTLHNSLCELLFTTALSFRIIRMAVVWVPVVSCGSSPGDNCSSGNCSGQMSEWQLSLVTIFQFAILQFVSRWPLSEQEWSGWRLSLKLDHQYCWGYNKWQHEAEISHLFVTACLLKVSRCQGLSPDLKYIMHSEYSFFTNLI